MSLTKLTENLNKVSSLPDRPTLTSEQLKMVFDESGNIIKDFINDILTVETERMILDQVNNTKTTLNSNITKVKSEILETVFPIGSTYITQNTQNPSEILKFGTWERLKGKVALGLDETDTNLDTIGKTGGEKTHKLTQGELPNINVAGSYNTEGQGWTLGNGGTPQLYTQGNMILGDGHTHNNMQPYEVVGYMWIRRR